jgi:hypothetical protein
MPTQLSPFWATPMEGSPWPSLGARRQPARLTTLTFASDWSTVRTVTPDAWQGQGSDSVPASVLETTTEYQHVVTMEPHDASPTSFPATVLQSVTTTHTYVASEGSSTVTVEPTSSQWILHRPSATDLARNGLGDPQPNAPPPHGWEPAPQCLDAGQQTGCDRQCAQRDGLWYCFDKHAWYKENVMGRVCWWTEQDDDSGADVIRYLMLAEPCREGDRHVECEACRLYG